MSVGPDDKKRALADAQLIGCCWRKACIRILIVGPSREHDGRFDEGRAVPCSYRAVESCEPIAVCRESTDEESRVSGAVGQLVQHADPAVREGNLDRVRESLARREGIVFVSHDDRRASVINVEFRLDDRLMEP